MYELGSVTWQKTGLPITLPTFAQATWGNSYITAQVFTITINFLHFRELEAIKIDEASPTISPMMLALPPRPASTPLPIDSLNSEENGSHWKLNLTQDTTSTIAVPQEVPSKIAHDIAVLRALNREIQGLRIKSLAELEPRCSSISAMDHRSEKSSVSPKISLKAANRKVASYKGVFVCASPF